MVDIDNTEQAAADNASAEAVESHLTGASPEQSEQAFNRASVEHRRATADPESGRDPGWRNGSETNEPAAFAPMPPAPSADAQVVTLAVNELSSIGAPGRALMDEWGGADSQNFAENIGYARQAVAEIFKTNPGILEFLGQVHTAADGTTSRAGDDPKWLRLAAEHGRLRSGITNERPSPMSNYRMQPASRPASGNQTLQEERKALMDKNPPGTPAYASPAVQRRLNQIAEALSGGQNIVGVGGRNA
jgi:hypothetical protein